MVNSIMKWVKVSVLTLFATISLVGALCAGTTEMVGLCVGLTVLSAFSAAAIAILD